MLIRCTIRCNVRTERKEERRKERDELLYKEITDKQQHVKALKHYRECLQEVGGKIYIASPCEL